MRTQVAPSAADLEHIASEVWASYLDPDGEGPLVITPVDRTAMEMVASVRVGGAWQGRVLISCSTALARSATAILLGVGSDEVATPDLFDAMGELANVIGGNVKGLLPEPSTLALPLVAMTPEGGPVAARPGDDEEVCRFEATWLDEPLILTVLQGPPRPEGESAE